MSYLVVLKLGSIIDLNQIVQRTISEIERLQQDIRNLEQELQEKIRKIDQQLVRDDIRRGEEQNLPYAYYAVMGITVLLSAASFGMSIFNTLRALQSEKKISSIDLLEQQMTNLTLQRNDNTKQIEYSKDVQDLQSKLKNATQELKFIKNNLINIQDQLNILNQSLTALQSSAAQNNTVVQIQDRLNSLNQSLTALQNNAAQSQQQLLDWKYTTNSRLNDTETRLNNNFNQLLFSQRLTAEAISFLYDKMKDAHKVAFNTGLVSQVPSFNLTIPNGFDEQDCKFFSIETTGYKGKIYGSDQEVYALFPSYGTSFSHRMQDTVGNVNCFREDALYGVLASKPVMSEQEIEQKKRQYKLLT